MANDEKNIELVPEPAAEAVPKADEAAAIEEAAEYYKNLEEERVIDEYDKDASDDSASKKTDEKAAKGTKEKLKFDFNIEDVLAEEIYEFPSQRKNDLLFYSSCIFVAAAFLCTAFYVGTNSSASDEELAETLDAMRASDSAYTEAISDNEELTDEIKELTQQSLQTQELTGAMVNYEDMKQTLESRLESVKADFQSKNDELYNLNQELAALKSQQGQFSVTLTPGVYSVGKNIPAGTYSIKGYGSIIAATAAGETRVNEQLSPDTAVSEELKDGYTVKINRTTDFVLSAAAGNAE